MKETLTIKIHQNASWTESLYVDREAEQFILRRNEERRLKNLANGLLDNESDDSDDESQEEENLAEVEDEEPSSRTRFEAGRSRSGRRVTRYLL